MKFEFDKELIGQQLLEIEDLGKCSIEAISDKMMYYYLIIQTKLGKSTVFTYGPTIPDLNILPDEITCSIVRIDFNEKKLKGIINYFLNDNKKKIKEAKIIELNDALDSCKDLIQYMRGGNVDDKNASN